MSVIGLIVILLVLAGVLYLVNTKGAAMNATIKLIINIVVIVIAMILVLAAFGVWEEVRAIKVPKI
jgi:membrane-bound ClpP family serine protease